MSTDIFITAGVAAAVCYIFNNLKAERPPPAEYVKWMKTATALCENARKVVAEHRGGGTTETSEKVARAIVALEAFSGTGCTCRVTEEQAQAQINLHLLVRILCLELKLLPSRG